MTYPKESKSKSGFALLMTIVVVSVLVSIGLSVLQLSISQVRLATNARDSEIAFHAANAGLECARYVRREFADEMENLDEEDDPATIDPVCFDNSSQTKDFSNFIDGVDVRGNGRIHEYQYAFEWGPAGSERCSDITTIILVAEPTEGLVMSNPRNYIPNYNGSSIRCDPGERCTIISVQGYDKACDEIATVQREVLLEF